MELSSYRTISAPWAIAALFLVLGGCATVSVTPGNIQPPDPLLTYNAIEAEPTLPSHIEVADFQFAPSSIRGNRSPLHRAIDLFRRSSAEQRHIAIGRDVAQTISKGTAKQLSKTGLGAIPIASADDLPLNGNFLLVTGRLIDVNEGNRLTRVALGFGLGESHLLTQVYVFRVVNGEKAQVLSFVTYADSGKMPGIAPSLCFGMFLIGPITTITAINDTLSTGQKIYSSQIEYLAGETGKQIAGYVSQYAAAEHWIPQNEAKQVNVAHRYWIPQG